MDIARLPNGALRVRVVPRRTWLVGLAPVAAAALALAFFGETGTLACRRVERGRIDCTLTRSLFGLERSRAELRGLTGASVSWTKSSSRSTATYRVELAARSGAEPLDSHYSAGASGKRAIVERINRFLEDERETDFTFRGGFPWGVVLFSLVFLAAGVLASPLWTPAVTWTFDRLAGSLVVNRRRVLGGRTTTYGLDQIRSAAVRFGHVGLRFTSGHQEVLTSDGDDARAHEAVMQIRGFLGLPPAPDPADEAVEVVQHGIAAFFRGRGGGATGVRLFRRAAQLDPRMEKMSRFVASVAGDPDEKRAEPRPAAAEALSAAGAAASPAPARPAAPSGTAMARSVPRRLLDVVLFRAPAYREIAEEPAAARSAAAIVILVAALVGFVGGMTSVSTPVNGRVLAAGPTHGLARMLIEVCAALVSWLVSAAVGAFVARALFRGRTDTAEMRRVLGYASVFRVLWLLPYGFTLSWILSGVGTVIAMREAAEFDTPRAVITAAIAWVAAFAVSGAIWLALTLAAVALLATVPA
jgi:hypothetical protein